VTSVTPITISDRYAGPPFGVNGGYIAGLLAEYAGVRSAHVELSAPVPMGRPLELVADYPMASISDQGRVLATAAPVSMLDMSHPGVDFVSATMAAGDVDPSDHPFPGCFVCGPDRGHDDGMHLLPGEVEPGVVAVPWRPTGWQAGDDGTIPLRLVTAALDCPSVFPVLGAGQAALLVAMTFGVERLPVGGEHLVVAGWGRRVHGRRLFTSSSVTSADGDTIARADTLWIGVDRERLAGLAARMVTA
jgi:hypothetical protein